MEFKLTLMIVQCAILMLVFGAVVDVKNIAEKEKETDGNCICGVFKEGDDPEKTKAIFEKKSNTPKYSHDEKGEKACQAFCISMAESAKDRAPMVLCNSINQDHVENLKVQLYAKLCGENWIFTGKSNSNPVCCHKGQPFKCGEVKENVTKVTN